MKPIFIIFFCLIAMNAICQIITPEKQGEIEANVKKKSVILKSALEKKDNYWSDEKKALIVEFKTDTFIIEETLRQMMDADYSTMGSVTSMNKATDAYDALLNKYYKKLSTVLSEEHCGTLKKAQLAWIKFRDAEKELYSTLILPEYSGGGSMQRIFYTSSYFELVKHRVIEIFNHLSSMEQE